MLNPISDSSKARNGPYTQLIGGVVIDLSNPDYSGVTVADVAHALAKIARYSGNTRGFVPVAYHSVVCADHAPEGEEWNCLMHDSPEIVTGDITAPIKTFVPGLRDYLKPIEDPFYAHFDVSKTAKVKEIDQRAAATEQRDVRPGRIASSARPVDLDRSLPFDIAIHPVEWREAERMFLDAAMRYAPPRVRRELMGTPWPDRAA